MAPPLVVVTARHRTGRDRGERWPHRNYVSPIGYADAIARAGGRPLVIPPITETEIDAADWLDGADGLMLTGGPDIDPARYGEAADPSVYGVDDATDDHEAALLEVALEHRMPVLAVCRGAQLLNVVLGGTLVQNLPGPPDHIDHGGPADRRPAVHDVAIYEGTRLHEAIGVHETTVWSIHHQAIDRLGDGLMVTARAPDHTIEAVEHRDPSTGWVVGVQWHPEDRAHIDPVQQRLFDSLVHQAALWADDRSPAALRS
jgi:gamma-glutamyl-gamma-aminobutyrate hydrolase PuuD